jgi:hypothetical protein
LATSSKERAILDQIREQPYYSVRIVPGHDLGDVDHETLRRALGETAVRLRGWDFPHFDPNTVYNTPAYVGTTVDWERHVELWRMYRSGQFVYFGGLWDMALDFQQRHRAEFDRDVIVANAEQKKSVAGLVSFVGMIYSVTEFYLFAARLAEALGFASDVRLRVALHHVEDWVLIAGEPDVLWHSFYQSKIDEIPLTPPRSGDLATDPVAAAASGLRELFASFNWMSPEATIKHYQEKFIAGRFAF